MLEKITRREILKLSAGVLAVTAVSSFGYLILASSKRTEKLREIKGNLDEIANLCKYIKTDFEGYWIDDRFAFHGYDKNILIKPEAILLIPAYINLRAKIESKKRIKTDDYASFSKNDREVPSLFWNENLVYSDGNINVFETKYCKEYDEILPTCCLDKIPQRLKRAFLREAPPKVHELAYKLIGEETDTRKILKKFHEFVVEHKKPLTSTTGKSIAHLLEEYEREGFFYGTCKEARDFYAALCNAGGFPTKKVMGKGVPILGHVWVDVFVPVDNGYRLFPVDPALDYFGSLDPQKHIFFERTPNINFGFLERVFNYDAEDFYLKLTISRIQK